MVNYSAGAYVDGYKVDKGHLLRDKRRNGDDNDSYNIMSEWSWLLFCVCAAVVEAMDNQLVVVK